MTKPSVQRTNSKAPMDGVFYIRPTARQKVISWLFPYKECPHDRHPAYADMVISIVRVKADFLDRLRILLTGKFEVEVRTSTMHKVGSTKSSAVIRAGRWWE